MTQDTPQQLPTRRSFLAAASAVLAASLCGLPTAYADRDAVVRAQFIGWSQLDPSVYLVRFIDPDRGNRLEIHKIGSPKPEASVKTTPSTLNTILASSRFTDWDFQNEGVDSGMKAPNGWILKTKDQGGYLGVLISNGSSSLQLGAIPAKPDGQGGFARMTVTNAYWSKDSSRVVVVVNHAKGGSWGLDVDVVQGFKIGG